MRSKTKSIKETDMRTTEMFPAEVETDGPETKNGIVKDCLHVKVRKEPGYDSDVLEILRAGDKVTILGKVGNFYRVSTSVNRDAYISSEFVGEE